MGKNDIRNLTLEELKKTIVDYDCKTKDFKEVFKKIASISEFGRHNT